MEIQRLDGHGDFRVDSQVGMMPVVQFPYPVLIKPYPSIFTGWVEEIPAE